MEFLGYFEDKPEKQDVGKWDYIEIEYPNNDAFIDATGKIIRGSRDNKCRFVVADEYNNRYFLDILDVRYDSQEYSVKIWPHDLWPVKKYS